jgi:hypothetical protein
MLAAGVYSMLIAFRGIERPPAIHDERLVEFPCGFRQLFGVHFGVRLGYSHLRLNIMHF